MKFKDNQILLSINEVIIKIILDIKNWKQLCVQWNILILKDFFQVQLKSLQS
jgi:hypothetical protein